MKFTIIISIFFLLITESTLSQTITLVPDDMIACPGSLSAIALNASGFDVAGAITLFIEYDTSSLKYDSITNLHSSLHNLKANEVIGYTKNTIIFSWYYIYGVPFDSVTMFNLCFTHQSGISEVSFTDFCEISDIGLNEFAAQYANAIISPAMTINKNAKDTTVYYPESAAFGVSAQGAALYRWQMSNKDGNTFLNLENNEFFEGVSNDTLCINYTAQWLDSTQFRCRLTRDSCTIFSQPAHLNITMPPYGEYEVNFVPGWNSFSSYLHPQFAAIDSVFKQISESVIFVCDGENIYYPSSNITTLSNFNSKNGYQIKFSEQSGFTFKGYEMTNKTILLHEGWNLMPCLSSNNIVIQEIDQAILDKIIVIKDAVGVNVFWPEKNISTLSLLEPGKAYLIKLSATTGFEFP